MVVLLVTDAPRVLRRPLVLTNAVNLDIDVIPGDNSLPSDRSDLDLDIHNTQRFGADVDVDETRVDGPVELAKAGDKTDGT